MKNQLSLALCLWSSVAFAQVFPDEVVLDRTAEGHGFSIYGEQRFNRAGAQVAGIGDFNNDGFSDIALSAPENRTNGVETGAVYILLGFPAANLESIDLGDLGAFDSIEIYGLDVEDLIGKSLAAAGDINGDGFDDVVIGSDRAIIVTRGEVYVVFGSASPPDAIDLSELDGVNGFKIEGIDDNDVFGKGMDGVGDVNGDGIEDLCVGASSGDSDHFASGEAYVLFGRSEFPPLVDLETIEGVVMLSARELSSSMGNDVAGVGDVNGDGLHDFVVSAEQSDAGGNTAGEAYLIYGSTNLPANLSMADLDGANGSVFVGEGGGDFFGGSAARAGDVNKDGFADFLIGANRADIDGEVRGASYLIYGRSSFPSEVDLGDLASGDGVKFEGADFEGSTGGAVAGDFDIDGDGSSDLMIGTPRAAANGDLSGIVHLIFGKNELPFQFPLETVDASNGIVFVGEDLQDEAGFDVDRAGDFNGDGLDDILIGAVESNEATGGAFVVFGQFATGVTLGSTAAGCPGTIDFRSRGLTSVGQATLFRGSGRGSSVVATGPCAGTELELEDAITVADVEADLEGIWLFSFPLGSPELCGTSLQILDLTTCAASNLARIPIE